MREKIYETLTDNQVNEIVKQAKKNGSMLSLEEHTAKLRKSASEGDWESVSEMALGMIQARSPYTGIARRALSMDTLTPGEQRVYSVATQTVPALTMNPYSGSAPIVRASMTRVVATPSRISSQFEIPAVDYLVNSVNPQDYYEKNAIWGMAIEEDYAFYTGLETAITLSQSITGTDYGSTTVAGNTFTWDAVTNLYGEMRNHRQYPAYLIMSEADAVDILNWSIVTSAVEFKEDLLKDPDYIPVAGGLKILRGFTVPKGTMYMITKPEQLGYFTQWGGRYIEPNPSKTDQAVKAFTCNEFIAQYIMNCKAVCKLVKGSTGMTTSTTYINPQANEFVKPIEAVATKIQANKTDDGSKATDIKKK